MKKVLSILLVFAMLLGTAAFAEGTSGFIHANDPITITGFSSTGAYLTVDHGDLPIWKVMEDLTGITIKFDTAPSSQYSEKIGLLFASNTLPDVIMKVKLGTSEVMAYAEEGQIIPIDPYLEEYAPNLSALLKEEPAIRKAITMADGHIYGFPYIVSAASSTVTPKLFINAKALEKLGKEIPTTLDELIDVMRAFKDSDYNGNGVKDEIGFITDEFDRALSVLYGVFGLGTRGRGNMNWDVDPETNSLRFIPTSEGYRDLMQAMNLMYQEGLMDQEIFTTKLATVTAKAEQDQLLFAGVQNSAYFGSREADFVSLEAPLVLNEGDTPFYAGRALSVQENRNLISSNCKYPEAVVQYLDYFYSDEGMKLFFMGIEGETWEYDENGNAVYTDYVTKNPDGKRSEEVLGAYTCWAGGNNPTIADNKYFGQNVGARTLEAAMKLEPYCPEEVWQAFTFPSEEGELAADYELDIGTYVTDMRAKFITGSESLDNWDAYVEQLNRMDLEGYTELVQSAVDRYNAL